MAGWYLFQMDFEGWKWVKDLVVKTPQTHLPLHIGGWWMVHQPPDRAVCSSGIYTNPTTTPRPLDFKYETALTICYYIFWIFFHVISITFSDDTCVHCITFHKLREEYTHTHTPPCVCLPPPSPYDPSQGRDLWGGQAPCQAIILQWRPQCPEWSFNYYLLLLT